VTTVHLALDPAADALLAADPLALLIGMVLDQQIPMERAFAAPAALQQRLGTALDARSIAAMDPEILATIFAASPALHRFPGSMAQRVHDLCRILVDEFDGQAAAVWRSAGSGSELVARLRSLPGFGEQKARIFAALLGKQFGIRPPGWEDATAPFGEPGVFRSVADIVDETSLAAVRATKADAKAKAKQAAALPQSDQQEQPKPRGPANTPRSSRTRHPA